MGKRATVTAKKQPVATKVNLRAASAIRLGFLVWDVSRLWRVVLDRALKPLGVTRSQYSIIAFLSRRDGMTQTALAADLELTKVAVGGLLERMGAVGLVERRADDVIIRGGFKVLPDEVADVLRLHPLVGDAAVIGLADERLGAVPGTVIERAAGRDFPTEAELLGYLRERLPSYKIPVRFAFVDSLPRTPTMKPQRQGLLALLEAAS
jgi:hypothetical protein